MSNVDGRIEARIESNFTIFIEVLASSVDHSSAGSIVVCNSLDVSPSGLQVVVDKPIPVESILRLCLDVKDRDPIYVVGEVKWQRPDTESNGVRLGFLLFESEDTDIDAWKLAIRELTL